MFFSTEFLKKVASLQVIVLALIIVPIESESADLSVAVNDNWPPFSYASGNTDRGVLVRLLTEIVETEMGYQISFEGYPWKRAQNRVKTGSTDALLTYPSDDRKLYAWPSRNIVYELEERAFARKGSKAEKLLKMSPDIEAFRSLSVCLLAGDSWARSYFGKHLVNYELGNDAENCLLRIARGRLDVFMQSAAAGLAAIKQGNLGNEIVMLDHIYTRVPFKLLVSKQRPDAQKLLEAFDTSIDKLKKEGRFKALIEKARLDN